MSFNTSFVRLSIASLFCLSGIAPSASAQTSGGKGVIPGCNHADTMRIHVWGGDVSQLQLVINGQVTNTTPVQYVDSDSQKVVTGSEVNICRDNPVVYSLNITGAGRALADVYFGDPVSSDSTNHYHRFLINLEHGQDTNGETAVGAYGL